MYIRKAPLVTSLKELPTIIAYIRNSNKTKITDIHYEGIGKNIKLPYAKSSKNYEESQLTSDTTTNMSHRQHYEGIGKNIKLA